MRRYKKARQEENNKKKKLILNFYNVNESNDEGNKIKNKKIHKSISQKNSLIYRQTLHNYLLDFETNNENHPLDNNKENHTSNNNKNIKIINN